MRGEPGVQEPSVTRLGIKPIIAARFVNRPAGEISGTHYNARRIDFFPQQCARRCAARAQATRPKSVQPPDRPAVTPIMAMEHAINNVILNIRLASVETDMLTSAKALFFRSAHRNTNMPSCPVAINLAARYRCACMPSIAFVIQACATLADTRCCFRKDRQFPSKQPMWNCLGRERQARRSYSTPAAPTLPAPPRLTTVIIFIISPKIPLCITPSNGDESAATWSAASLSDLPSHHARFDAFQRMAEVVGDLQPPRPDGASGVAASRIRAGSLGPLANLAGYAEVGFWVETFRACDAASSIALRRRTDGSAVV